VDRAYIIRQGQIFREGPPRVLISDPEVRAVYLGHSFDAPVMGISADEASKLVE
jgi:ABC-type lipopolysaccharide export system ATPase subunit